MILLSEIVAYGQLCKIFEADLRQGRLKVREETYRRMIPRLLCDVNRRQDPDWRGAQEIAVELQRRYNPVFLAS